MNAVTISQRFRVTIPAAQRRRLGLRAGDRLVAIDHNGLLALVPVRKAAEMRGFLAGMDASIERDADRRTTAKRASRLCKRPARAPRSRARSTRGSMPRGPRDD